MYTIHAQCTNTQTSARTHMKKMRTISSDVREEIYIKVALWAIVTRTTGDLHANRPVPAAGYRVYQ